MRNTMKLTRSQKHSLTERPTYTHGRHIQQQLAQWLMAMLLSRPMPVCYVRSEPHRYVTIQCMQCKRLCHHYSAVFSSPPGSCFGSVSCLFCESDIFPLSSGFDYCCYSEIRRWRIHHQWWHLNQHWQRVVLLVGNYGRRGRWAHFQKGETKNCGKKNSNSFLVYVFRSFPLCHFPTRHLHSAANWCVNFILVENAADNPVGSILRYKYLSVYLAVSFT